MKGEERCRSGKESRALEMAMSGGLLLCCREKRGYSVYRLAVLNESAKRGYGIMLDILGGGSSVSDNCGVDDTLYLSESDFTVEDDCF